MFPKRRFQPRIETVVESQEIADLVPRSGRHTVIQIAHRRRRRKLAMSQEFHKSLALAANYHQRRGFERLDESARIADSHDIVHPSTFVSAGPKFH